jgi:hypothetical protein
MADTIGGLEVRSTKNLVNANTRICNLTYAGFKSGKTQMAGTMHEYCMTAYNKPGLFMAFEASEGGGTTTVQDMDIPYVQPTDLRYTEAVFRGLLTDTKYAAVFVDNISDMIKSVVQPYALSFPAKENIATRIAGVPERSDYQTIGERTRLLVNMMIALTKTPDPKFRKHIIVNCLQYEQRNSKGELESSGPDLPGMLSESIPAMFEMVTRIKVGQKVVQDPITKATTRVPTFTFIAQQDGIHKVGDRYKVFPGEGPCDWTELMTKYWEKRITNA